MTISDGQTGTPDCLVRPRLLTAYTQPCKLWAMVSKRAARSRRAQWDRERVRALRQHLGLTQSQLAEQLGTRQQTISEWEKGIYRPRGASATLLSIVAERARFKYDATEPNQED